MAFLTQVDTETLSDQTIAAALLVGTFTNTTRIRKLYINVFLDQIQGNGAYVCYVTIQRAAAGSAYETIRTTKDAASGVTAIVFNSMPVTLNSTDVMKVYVIGLSTDTTTVDIIVDVNEELPDTAVTIASGGIISGAHAAAELNAIADAILDRNMATGVDSGTDSTVTRTPRQALRVLRNKRAIAAGSLSVKKEDDVTNSWTAAVTTAAGNPTDSIDPT